MRMLPVETAHIYPGTSERIYQSKSTLSSRCTTPSYLKKLCPSYLCLSMVEDFSTPTCKATGIFHPFGLTRSSIEVLLCSTHPSDINHLTTCDTDPLCLFF